MMKRAAIVTLYNPGNVGARYVAAALKEAGVTPYIINIKQFYTDPWVRRDDVEQIRRIEAEPTRKVRFTFPGWYAYSPYPMPITECEKRLLADYLRSLDLDLIGISLFSVNLRLARELTEWLRRELPNVPIAWGGVHAVVRPEQCVEWADIVCVGEGERPMAELARQWDAYKRGENPAIEGIWYRRGQTVTRNPRPPYVTDLDSLPIPLYAENDILVDFDRIDERLLCDAEYLSRGFNVVVMTERGCPYSCSFCVYSVLHDLYPGQPRFRRRSVENVLAEIEDRVVRLGQRHIIFHDEILCMQKDWVHEFSAKFKERFKPLGVTFTGYVHPLTTDEESLGLMVEAGLTRTGIGLQSGSHYTSRRIYNRYHKPEKVVELSRLIAKYKIPHTQIDLLVDNPFEREEHLRETLDLLLQLEPPFDVACIGLVVYDECRLAELPPPDFPYDENMHRFYNMLFHLTGIADLDRKTIRDWSNDAYLREHPERLEEIAIVAWDLYRKKRVVERELNEMRSRAAPPPGPCPPPAPPSAIRALLGRIRRAPRGLRRRLRTMLGRALSS